MVYGVEYIEDVLTKYLNKVDPRYAVRLIENYHGISDYVKSGLRTYKTRWWVRKATQEIQKNKGINKEKKNELGQKLGVDWIKV